MKKVEMYIRPEKLDTMKDILSKHGCHGMSIFTVMGCGRQKGYVAEMAIRSTYYRRSVWYLS